jgi:polyribonucleotide nucleotidyltransferase
MVEAGAHELPEETIIEAMKLAQETNEKVIATQEELVKICGVPKMELPTLDASDEIENDVYAIIKDRLLEVLNTPEGKSQSKLAKEAFETDLNQKLQDKYPEEDINNTLQSIVKRETRRRILEEGIRPDGRGLKDIRPISTEVGILPRTHGTGLFSRGMTQVLSIATLGSLAEVQKLDTLSPEVKKRYMHHYNFPPYSVGEVGRVGSPGRREIGHGALAERALIPVVPSEEEFPYTIRVVSEVLSSNGSTSMGSVCGSSLALMDAGVPIKAPVAGAAMGLITDANGKYAVLTDIQGVEDHIGDMDFKVAGTEEGVTALQMDIKVGGIGWDVISQALKDAKEARLFILSKMNEAISQARSTVNEYAPRMHRIKIPTDKIGVLIGPGGKMIRSLIEEYKVTIDVDNEGTVTVGASDGQSANKVLDRINLLTKEVELNETYTGKVTRLMSFGAFVELVPGKEGLVRIGELSDQHIESVESFISEGDELEVKVIEKDHMGRINLSHRAILEGDSYQRRPNNDGPRRDNRGQRPGFKRPFDGDRRR